MERNSRKLIRRLEQDGWVLDRVNGDHHTFKHPNKEKIITITHPSTGFAERTGAADRTSLPRWRP